MELAGLKEYRPANVLRALLFTNVEHDGLLCWIAYSYCKPIGEIVQNHEGAMNGLVKNLKLCGFT